MIRWGIIGAGRVASDFVTALRTLPDTDVTMVCSRHNDRAKAFAESYSISAFTDNYQSLIERDDVDVCYVGTPNASHVEISIAAMAAGKAVICEKPIACDCDGIDRIIDQWNRSENFCMEAMWMRFMPIIRHARQMIERGDIGTPLHLQADFTIPAPRDPANRFFNKELGGGCLLDRGVYGVSLAHAFFGKPQCVHADALIGDTGVDEHTVIQLRHSRHEPVLSTIACGLRSWGSNDATVMGTEGVIRLGKPFFRPDYVTLHRFAKPMSSTESSARSNKISHWPLPTAAKRWIVRARTVKQNLMRGGERLIEPLLCNGYEYEAQEVNRCLVEGQRESPLMPLRESRDVIETLAAVRQCFASKTDLHR